MCFWCETVLDDNDECTDCDGQGNTISHKPSEYCNKCNAIIPNNENCSECDANDPEKYIIDDRIDPNQTKPNEYCNKCNATIPNDENCSECDANDPKKYVIDDKTDQKNNHKETEKPPANIYNKTLVTVAKNLINLIKSSTDP